MVSIVDAIPWYITVRNIKPLKVYIANYIMPLLTGIMFLHDYVQKNNDHKLYGIPLHKGIKSV